MIEFNRLICGDLKAATSREWLETNGLGGFASSTITGLNTRRYHALLVAAMGSPSVRVALLSKFEETIIIGSVRYDLSTNLYAPDVIHPHGYLVQMGFRLDPFPISTFRIGDVEIEKRVFMLHGENTTVVRYRLNAPSNHSVTLELRPLVALRDYHSLAHEDHRREPQVVIDSSASLRIASPVAAMPALYLLHTGTVRGPIEEVWYKNFLYTEEAARGFYHLEDLFNPCVLSFALGDGETCDIIASTEQREAQGAAEFEERELARRRAIVEVTAHENDNEHLRTLRAGADQFLIKRAHNRSSIIAGYHWFTDWGRDTMIALTGLTLTTKRFDTAREILLTFAEQISEGMIPNRFPDGTDEPEYNTVDATLWFVHAVGEFLRRTGEANFIRENLYPRLKEIIAWHERGTRYRIKVDTDGLLSAGDAGVQLTWMDAKIGDYVVTPRAGNAVEIQALWYNALRTVEEMAAGFDDEAMSAHCNYLAARAHASFNQKFWNEADKCLFDCIDTEGKTDASVRPNQIFAISLPFAILAGNERAASVLHTIERELLTPYGLRSLSPRDKDYRGRYVGDAYSRDTAYHQGTVWSWLMGPFITAFLKVNTCTPENIARARAWTFSFHEHLKHAGAGQISEIFDGDAPHEPRGAIVQAWSVAELLRCEVEEFTPDAQEEMRAD